MRKYILGLFLLQTSCEGGALVIEPTGEFTTQDILVVKNGFDIDIEQISYAVDLAIDLSSEVEAELDPNWNRKNILKALGDNMVVLSYQEGIIPCSGGNTCNGITTLFYKDNLLNETSCTVKSIRLTYDSCVARTALVHELMHAFKCIIQPGRRKENHNHTDYLLWNAPDYSTLGVESKLTPTLYSKYCSN